MSNQSPQPTGPGGQTAPGLQGAVAASRPVAYVLILLAVVLAVSAYQQRREGLFSCQGSDYQPDRYLAYCQATGYGDYDHGAFWFGLEPGALAAATDAQVLFLGNSRMQHGFSSGATADWFSASATRYFLLGFSHYVNVAFEAPLLQKIMPRARVYIINADRFFEQHRSELAELVMADSSARNRYEHKRLWQPVHRALCGSVSVLCGDEYVIFRSRETGAWKMAGGRIRNVPVSYDGAAEAPDSVAARTAAARALIATLPVPRECVILTLVPYVRTDVGTARSVAAALGVTLIAPEPQGLNTFDGGHLDRPSADRWSAAFFAAAGPRIRDCLAAGGDSTAGVRPTDGAAH